MTNIELTMDEAFAVANLIDFSLLDYIRADTDIDSLEWLRNVIHAYEKMCDFSGYIGYTEKRKEE